MKANPVVTATDERRGNRISINCFATGLTYTRGMLLLIADLSIFPIMWVLLDHLRPDIAFPAGYALLFPYLVATGRRHLIQGHVVAIVCSLAWMFYGGDIYGYRDRYLYIGDISVYPLAAWAMCFSLSLVLSNHWRFRVPSWWKAFLAYCIVYWIIVLGYETIAYHLLGIRNPATVGYPGLPICDCIHAPLWVQVSYLSMGPLYYLVY